MPWYTEGLKTLPVGSGTVLADTGALADGSYNVYALHIAADLAATVEVQHRNAANTANIFAQRYYMSAASPIVVQDAGAPPRVLNTDERIRVVLIGALTLGNCQASFFLT